MSTTYLYISPRSYRNTTLYYCILNLSTSFKYLLVSNSLPQILCSLCTSSLGPRAIYTNMALPPNLLQTHPSLALRNLSVHQSWLLWVRLASNASRIVRVAQREAGRCLFARAPSTCRRDGDRDDAISHSTNAPSGRPPPHTKREIGWAPPIK